MTLHNLKSSYLIKRDFTSKKKKKTRDTRLTLMEYFKTIR